MRRRMIDPAIWDDPDVNSLPPLAMILFIGLFSNADDLGNIQADPRYLRKKLFGYRDVTIEQVRQWRAACLQLRSVTLYQVNGAEYIHLENWTTYQKLDSRYTPKASCPPFPDNNDEIPPTPPADDASSANSTPPEESDVKVPQSPDIERDTVESKVKRSQEKLSKEKKRIAASPPSSLKPPKLKPIPPTEGQRFFLDAFGRKRFATNIQKQSVADIEAEVGLERWKNAVTWAARNNIRNLDSMITAARSGKRKSTGGKLDDNTKPRTGERSLEERQAEWDAAVQETEKRKAAREAAQAPG